MVDFIRVSANSCRFTTDISVFSQKVITKAVYWLANTYLVYWKPVEGSLQPILLEKKQGNIADEELHELKSTINQQLIDFKTRDIVEQETRNIRDILYVKAFANGDDFEDFNLIS